jgi:hypothetical protein
MELNGIPIRCNEICYMYHPDPYDDWKCWHNFDGYCTLDKEDFKDESICTDRED